MNQNLDFLNEKRFNSTIEYHYHYNNDIIKDDIIIYLLRHEIYNKLKTQIELQGPQMINNELTINQKKTIFIIKDLKQFIEMIRLIKKMKFNYNLKNIIYQYNNHMMNYDCARVLNNTYNFKITEKLLTKYPFLIKENLECFKTLTMIETESFDILTHENTDDNFFDILEKYYSCGRCYKKMFCSSCRSKSEMNHHMILKLIKLGHIKYILHFILHLENHKLLVSILNRNRPFDALKIKYFALGHENIPFTVFCAIAGLYPQLVSIIKFLSKNKEYAVYEIIDNFRIKSIILRKYLYRQNLYEFIKHVVKDFSFNMTLICDHIESKSLLDFCATSLLIRPSVFLSDLGLYDSGIKRDVPESYYLKIKLLDYRSYKINNSILKFDGKIVDIYHDKFALSRIEEIINEQYYDIIKILNSDLMKIIFEYSSYIYNSEISIDRSPLEVYEEKFMDFMDF
jgi:hypothetical protein